MRDELGRDIANKLDSIERQLKRIADLLEGLTNGDKILSVEPGVVEVKVRELPR
jgi:hypothetical protein